MNEAIGEKYQEVIGLEVHVQLLTQSKAYAGDTNEYGHQPNTNISTFTLAHPGTLPRSNKKVFDDAIKLGLACYSEITTNNFYDRKNYFYPDLPKGYQITQYHTPICVGGYIPIVTKSGEEKQIHLHQIHMEEDAGKSLHLDDKEDTLVDYNRAGVPLLEIVTKPEITSAEEASAVVSEIRKLVRYLDICDGNMEEGSLRCDVNVSVMLKGATQYGTRVEVKNLNSIRHVQKTIEHEVERQIQLVEKEIEVVSETRFFNANTGTTIAMRHKEELNDYRYFPEPDLPPVIIDEKWIARIKTDMPTLPHELRKKFVQEYNLPKYDANVLTQTKDIALFFDEVCQHTKNYKAASNWVMVQIKSFINEQNLSLNEFVLSSQQIAEIIQLIDDNKVSHTVAVQQLFPKLLDSPSSTVEQIAHENNLIQESGVSSIQDIIDIVMKEYPDIVERYKAGNEKLLGMLMGQVMKKSHGKVAPKLANQLIKETLDK